MILATGRLISSGSLVRLYQRRGPQIANYNYTCGAIYNQARDRDIPPSLKSFFQQR